MPQSNLIVAAAMPHDARKASGFPSSFTLVLEAAPQDLGGAASKKRMKNLHGKA